jgi:acetyl esterase/lipase
MKNHSGGAHTLYSAKSTLGRAAIFADDTGHRAISVDYTLAPEAKFDQMSDSFGFTKPSTPLAFQ